MLTSCLHPVLGGNGARALERTNGSTFDFIYLLGSLNCARGAEAF